MTDEMSAEERASKIMDGEFALSYGALHELITKHIRAAERAAENRALERAAEWMEGWCDAHEMGAMPYGKPMPTVTELAAGVRDLKSPED